MLSNNQLDFIDDLIEGAKHSKTIKASKICEICSSDSNDYDEVVRMFEDEGIEVINDVNRNHSGNHNLNDPDDDDDNDDNDENVEPELEPAELKQIENDFQLSLNSSDESEQAYHGYVDSTKSYFNEVGDIPLLTTEEEIYYSRIVQEGLMAKNELNKALDSGRCLTAKEKDDLNYKILCGEEARDVMYESNTKLVISIAKKYVNRGIELQDAIQEGGLGLIKSIEKFDNTKGFKFSTYAYYWITQTIQRAIAEKTRSIRLPVHVIEAINRMEAKERYLEGKLNRKPTEEELAQELRITVTKLSEMRNLSHTTSSLDAPIGEDDDDTTRGDLTKDENTMSGLEYTIMQDKNDKIHQAINRLTEQEQFVINHRFGFIDRPHTLQEIADMLHLSRERIRQVEEVAMRKLRIYLKDVR